MSKVRHQDVVDGTVNTHLGEATIEKYHVKSLRKGDKHVDPEQLLTESVPGFLDSEAFPAPSTEPVVDPNFYSEHGVHSSLEEAQSAGKEKAEPTDATDEELLQIQIELAQDESNLNTAGYVDIDKINKALRQKGLKTTNGSRRKQVWDDRPKKLEVTLHGAEDQTASSAEETQEIETDTHRSHKKKKTSAEG